MIRSLWIAKTGMEGQQNKLDAISNNLANVGTTGYKRGGIAFEDLMYQNLRPAGSATSEQTQLPTGLQVGLGVRTAASVRNFGQGAMQNTGNNLDLSYHQQTTHDKVSVGHNLQPLGMYEYPNLTTLTET
jgi:flagellar basal-body rod protein FlgG